MIRRNEVYMYVYRWHKRRIAYFNALRPFKDGKRRKKWWVGVCNSATYNYHISQHQATYREYIYMYINSVGCCCCTVTTFGRTCYGWMYSNDGRVHIHRKFKRELVNLSRNRGLWLGRFLSIHNALWFECYVYEYIGERGEFCCFCHSRDYLLAGLSHNYCGATNNYRRVNRILRILTVLHCRAFFWISLELYE